jgi:septum formation protein
LVAEGGKSIKSTVSRAEVYFKALKPEELKGYLETKEPYDKAGAYDIQGTARQWIDRLEGDYFTVLGLPLGWVIQELNRTNAAV